MVALFLNIPGGHGGTRACFVGLRSLLTTRGALCAVLAVAWCVRDPPQESKKT